VLFYPCWQIRTDSGVESGVINVAHDVDVAAHCFGFWLLSFILIAVVKTLAMRASHFGCNLVCFGLQQKFILVWKVTLATFAMTRLREQIDCFGSLAMTLHTPTEFRHCEAVLLRFSRNKLLKGRSNLPGSFYNLYLLFCKHMQTIQLLLKIFWWRNFIVMPSFVRLVKERVRYGNCYKQGGVDISINQPALL